ncbi:4201_t:CDS:2, partial [Racocetra fulgida]
PIELEKLKRDLSHDRRWQLTYAQIYKMLEYYEEVSGCYIIRPLAYNIWQEIQNLFLLLLMIDFFDSEIKKLGVEDTYFPMFVSQRQLEREKDHIEGFAPEVAWVTKATREFLWQEGHTAHFTKEEADAEVRQILELYRQVYEDLLAVPVIKGLKSEKEKFAGGLYTTTIEGFIPTTGRGIQAATSHCLGQNFAKMFDIVVEDPNAPANSENKAKKLHVWQNSWGLTTRSIGVMVMIHDDDKGLVLPPRIASIQVIVIPCGLTVKTSEEDKKRVEEKINDVVKELNSVGIKAKADLRDTYTPGYKFNHWELRGVPLRLEIGPRDLTKNQTLSVRRDNGVKDPIPLDKLTTCVPDILNTIQKDMFERAKKIYDDHVKVIHKWEDFVPALDSKNVVLVPWCEQEHCEDKIKEKKPEDDKAPSMGAKSLCIPFEQPTEPPIVPNETKCISCDGFAKRYALFGRSY